IRIRIQNCLAISTIFFGCGGEGLCNRAFGWLENECRQVKRQSCEIGESARRGLPGWVPRVSNQQTICYGGHPSTGGHREAFLVPTVRLCKPRATGIGLQRQFLVLPAVAEPWPAGPHTELSGAGSGHPEIPTHHDALQLCLC